MVSGYRPRCRRRADCRHTADTLAAVPPVLTATPPPTAVATILFRTSPSLNQASSVGSSRVELQLCSAAAAVTAAAGLKQDGFVDLVTPTGAPLVLHKRAVQSCCTTQVEFGGQQRVKGHSWSCNCPRHLIPHLLIPVLPEVVTYVWISAKYVVSNSKISCFFWHGLAACPCVIKISLAKHGLVSTFAVDSSLNFRHMFL
ncbi:MAG: hypothetical protein J3K34DRAFT_450583 [Monoraphidium minutum]|nr:MAG: hypothetical protein J3K34DRAFT_450583 [Monoraphidium minutum]